MADNTETSIIDETPLTEPKKKVNITEQEKLDFYKSFLSDEPFSSSELLFEQVKATFKTLTVQESTDVYDQLRRDQTADLITNDAVYALKLTSYRLALSLTTFNDKPFEEKITREAYKPKDATDSYVKAKANVIAGWASFKLSALVEVFKSFEDKVMELTKSISDETFWKAAK